jgi:hypothetical protein
MATAKRKKEPARESPMELPRVQRAFEQNREFRLRLPPDLSDEIEKESAESGLPQNRVIINRLARVKPTDSLRKHEELNRDVEELLSRYSALITLKDFGKDVRQAIEDVVNAKPAELPVRVDKLRILYRNMLKLERTAAE